MGLELLLVWNYSKLEFQTILLVTIFFAHRCVIEQQGLAESSTYEVAEIAQHLAAAQSQLIHSDKAASQASRHLEVLHNELKAARASYNLLLMPKQWSRYKW